MSNTDWQFVAILAIGVVWMLVASHVRRTWLSLFEDVHLKERLNDILGEGRKK